MQTIAHPSYQGFFQFHSGVWIDHACAIVINLGPGDRTSVRRIESGVDGHFRLSGGWKSGNVTQEIADEKRVERRRRQQLDRYYVRVSESLQDVEQVLILGPGEAKHEFRKVLKEKRRVPHAALTVITADKMSNKQILAAVRRFFSTQ